MPVDIEQLSDKDAVKGLSLVAEAWMANRGREVYVTFYGTIEKAGDSYSGLPDWSRNAQLSLEESGEFARRMLASLADATDDEVRVWTAEALSSVSDPHVHIDPITLSIGGIILIGAILAARVRKIGPVEFYKGIPEGLAKVIKAGASITGH